MTANAVPLENRNIVGAIEGLTSTEGGGRGVTAVGGADEGDEAGGVFP